MSKVAQPYSALCPAPRALPLAPSPPAIETPRRSGVHAPREGREGRDGWWGRTSLSTSTTSPTECRAGATGLSCGFTTGRVRLSIARERPFSRVVQIRFAQLTRRARVRREEPPPDRGPGEREVTTPEEHNFRYMLAFARDAGAGVEVK